MIRLLLTRPVLFFALLTVGLGGLGAAGMLRGRFGGSQPVSGGAVGFAFGGALGLLVTLAYVVLRSRARPNGFVVTLVALAGTVAVVGLFVALTH